MSGYRRNLMGAEASKPKGPKYLIFEPLVDDFSFEFPYDLYYSTDGVDWLLLESATESPYFSKDERIYLKAELVPEPGYGIGSFSIYGKCNLSGNCMSLLYGDNAEGKTTAPDSAFSYLFEDCSTIIDASSLLLPATILEDGCYEYMFTGCSGLIFAPKIHATILARGCCHMMFYGCTNLINAPVLLATTLVDECYTNMFQNCSKLRYIKALFTTTPGSDYTYNWLSGVSSKGTFIKSKNATWDITGVSGVPTGWTIKFDGEEEEGINVVLQVNADNGQTGIDVYNYIAENSEFDGVQLYNWYPKSDDNIRLFGSFDGITIDDARVTRATSNSPYNSNFELFYVNQGTYHRANIRVDGYVSA